MPRAEFEIIPPYDLELSLRFAIYCRFESDSDRPDHFRRIILIDNEPVLIEVSSTGSIDKPVGVANWKVLSGKRVDRITEKVFYQARRIVCADLNLKPFYKKANESQHLKKVIQRFCGLKPILTPTVFEAAAWAIMGQQLNLTFASKIKNRVVEKYGRQVIMKETYHTIFPEPSIMARAKIGELRRIQFSQRKAEYLTGLAKGIVNSHYDLEGLSEMPYGEATEQLKSIRGIGEWSANYILMRGVGHPDCLPVGDTGLHKAVKILYNMEDIPDDDELRKKASKFSSYRSLFTLYLWYYLMNQSEAV